jgi:hypothetical protein
VGDLNLVCPQGRAMHSCMEWVVDNMYIQLLDGTIKNKLSYITLQVSRNKTQEIFYCNYLTYLSFPVKPKDR